MNVFIRQRSLLSVSVLGRMHLSQVVFLEQTGVFVDFAAGCFTSLVVLRFCGKSARQSSQPVHAVSLSVCSQHSGCHRGGR